MRVVSVLPSATEIVAALGHAADLVGRSAECDYPLDVRSLPVVMSPKTWDADSSSAVIDARVADARGRGESLYALDANLLRELQPDLLLTQDLCGVCSVTGDEVAEACRLAGIHPTVISLSPKNLEEVWRSVEEVGIALGDAEAGRALAHRLRGRSAPLRNGSSARVAVMEWLDPPILAGLWTPDIIRAAGGSPMATRSGVPGLRTGWDDLEALQPDLVVVSPCSFSVSRTARELEDPVIRTRLARLAPPRGTFVADEAYFSRPGPRLADGVDLVRHLLNADRWEPPMPVVDLRASGAAA